MKTSKYNCFLLALLLCFGLVWGTVSSVVAGQNQDAAAKASIMTQGPQMTPISDYQGTDWRNATTVPGVG